jgi:hypothetical protein
VRPVVSTFVLGLSVAASGAAAAATKVHLFAPSKLAERVEAGLRRERPDLELVADPRAAELILRIYGETDAWVLAVVRGPRVVETRQLGRRSDVESAVRVAVLIALRRIAELEAEAPPPPVATATVAVLIPPAGTATIAEPRVARREPVRSVVETSTPAPELRDWEIELAADLVGWAGPFAVRPGIAAAGFRRFAGFELGARAAFSGLCCTIHGDGIDGDATSAALFAEARYPARLGPVEAHLAAAIGVSLELIRARASSFENGEEETGAVFGTAGRLALGIDFAPERRWAVAAAAGIQWHAAGFSARLPAPLDREGGRVRDPLERGPVLPFAELGARIDL